MLCLLCIFTSIRSRKRFLSFGAKYYYGRANQSKAISVIHRSALDPRALDGLDARFRARLPRVALDVPILFLYVMYVYVPRIRSKAGLADPPAANASQQSRQF